MGECNFCEKENLPYNTQYGALWLDNNDNMLKWTSRQCSLDIDCESRKPNIVNAIRINYCPMCGRSLVNSKLPK